VTMLLSLTTRCTSAVMFTIWLCWRVLIVMLCIMPGSFRLLARGGGQPRPYNVLTRLLAFSLIR